MSYHFDFSVDSKPGCSSAGFALKTAAQFELSVSHGNFLVLEIVVVSHLADWFSKIQMSFFDPWTFRFSGDERFSILNGKWMGDCYCFLLSVSTMVPNKYGPLSWNVWCVFVMEKACVLILRCIFKHFYD